MAQLEWHVAEILDNQRLRVRVRKKIYKLRLVLQLGMDGKIPHKGGRKSGVEVFPRQPIALLCTADHATNRCHPQAPFSFEDLILKLYTYFPIFLCKFERDLDVMVSISEGYL